MFFIVNITKSGFPIGDLGIKLGPQQAVDLDKLVGRKRADDSRDLKILVSKGRVKIKTKTKNIKSYLENNLIKEKSNNFDQNKLLEAIREILPTGTKITEEGLVNKQEVKIDEKLLSEIHARAVDKMTKDTEIGSINY